MTFLGGIGIYEFKNFSEAQLEAYKAMNGETKTLVVKLFKTNPVQLIEQGYRVELKNKGYYTEYKDICRVSGVLVDIY